MILKKLLKGCLISTLIGSMILGSSLTINTSAMTTYILYFTGYPQARSLWCWAASAETSAKYMGSYSRTQYDAVRYLKGSTTNPTPNVSGLITDTAKAAMYICNNAYSYKGDFSSKSQFFLIGQLMEDKMPIAGAGKYNNNGTRTSGHATPIMAMIISDSAVVNIGYYDPAKKGTYSCTFSQFCDGTYNGRKYDRTCYIE